MVLKSSQERVKTLLKDTITLLCKNGLEFKKKFNVEALIGVTLDDDEVFLISMNELVKADNFTEVEDVPDTTTHSSKPRKGSSHRKRRRSSTDQFHVTVKQEAEALDADDTAELRSPPSGDTEAFSRGHGSAAKRLAMEDSEEQGSGDQEYSESPLREDAEQDSSDLVIIKEELQDEGLPSCSKNASNNFPMDFSSFSQGPSFLSEADLMPSGSMWSPGPSARKLLTNPRQRYPSGTSEMSSVPQQQQLNMSDMSQQSGGQFQQQQQQQRRTTGPHGCTTCGKVFCSKSTLRFHEDWHMGKFRYYCSICSKGFMASTNLKGHMATHTGRKEFKCSLCGTEFGYKHTLKDHVINVHQRPDLVP